MPTDSATYNFIDSNDLQLKYSPSHGWSANLLSYGIKVCQCGKFNPFETLQCKGCGEALIVTNSPDPIIVADILRATPQSRIIRFYIKVKYKAGVMSKTISEDEFHGNEFEFKKAYPDGYFRILNKDIIEFWTPKALRMKENNSVNFIQVFDSLEDFRKMQSKTIISQ